ncbi:MAG: hypothetical protein AB7I30_22615, partial [Isosphaeraceae bacterium]
MLWWIAETSLLAGALAAVAALVSRVGRLGPAARHALWLVVLLKLVTPPLVRSPWAFPRPAPSQTADVASTAIVPPDAPGLQARQELVPNPGRDEAIEVVALLRKLMILQESAN